MLRALLPQTWSAIAVLTYYDEQTGEPHQRERRFGRTEEDHFDVLEAGSEEDAKDEAREILIRDTTDAVEIDEISVYAE